MASAVRLIWSACSAGKERRSLLGLGEGSRTGYISGVSVIAFGIFINVGQGDVGDRRKGGVHQPRGLQKLVPHHDELGDNARDIEVGPVGEEEVPEAQDLREGRSAGAEGEDGGEGVDLSRETLGGQEEAELGVHDGEGLVDEREPPVHAVHGAPDVPWTLPRQQPVERHECLRLAPRRVQERRRQHIHPLHVRPWLRRPRPARPGL